MNERIQGLVKQAGGSVRNVCHGHGDYRNELQLSDEQIENFVELIVKSCVNAIPLDMDDAQYLKAMRGVKNALGNL